MGSMNRGVGDRVTREHRERFFEFSDGNLRTTDDGLIVLKPKAKTGLPIQRRSYAEGHR
jgi:hypothetical protein